MAGFAVGDRVIIRFGHQQGLKGKVIGSQPAAVYKVRMDNGPVLYFSGKGLAADTEGIQKVVS